MSMTSHLSVSRRIRGGSFDSSLSSDACSGWNPPSPRPLTQAQLSPCVVSIPVQLFFFYSVQIYSYRISKKTSSTASSPFSWPPRNKLRGRSNPGPGLAGAPSMRPWPTCNKNRSNRERVGSPRPSQTRRPRLAPSRMLTMVHAFGVSSGAITLNTG